MSSPYSDKIISNLELRRVFSEISLPKTLKLLKIKLDFSYQRISIYDNLGENFNSLFEKNEQLNVLEVIDRMKDYDVRGYGVQRLLCYKCRNYKKKDE